MAILKQNGTSAKVIRANQSGKVLKQNYNFGNALSKFRFVINIPTTSFEALSIEQWIKIGDNNIGAGVIAIYDEAGNYNSIIPNIGNATRWAYNGAHISTYNRDQYMSPNNIYHFILEAGSSTARANFNLRINNLKESKVLPALQSIDSSKINKIAILNNTNSFKVSTLRLYDRYLNESQSTYQYNNKLGNGILNKRGLIGEYNMQVAEIINARQSDGTYADSICIRDLSGYENHGIIDGLPAGSLSEKLIYANENAIVKW